MVVLNLIVLVLLIWAADGLRTLLIDLLFCYTRTVVALCGGAVLFALLHGLLRPLGPALDGLKIKGGGLEVVVGPVSTVVNLLQPAGLSDGWLWSAVIAVLVVSVATLLVLGRVHEKTSPVVKTFSVSPISTEQAKTYEPRAVLPIEPDQTVLIHIETLCEEPRCTWNSYHGTLDTAEECAMLYHAPDTDSWDYVIVEVETRCKTRAAHTGLYVQVGESTP
jgi:hypothetical protein